MLFYVLAALLAFAAAAVVVRPLLKNGVEDDAPEAFNASVYRDQLAELDRDVARGEIGADEAAAIRAEVARRLLAAKTQASATPPANAAGPAKRAAIALLALAPIAAGGLYAVVGSPGAADQPLKARLDANRAPAPGQLGAEPMHAEMAGLVDELAAKLAEEPNRPDGWALLARSLVRLDRYDEAVDAYKRALDLVGEADPALAAEYAEARIVANDGVVDMEALGVFRRRLAADAADPQARYYLALAQAQSGEVEAAVTAWRKLLTDSPADAPWRPAVERQIAEAERAAGGANPPRGPSQAEIDAASQLAPADQAAMIEGMVAGLAERLKSEPDDLEGWRRLARSYGVLGKPDEAAAAYERVLALSPEDPDALWTLGGVAAEAGDTALARERWSVLAALLPEGSTQRAEVEAAIAGLD